MALFEFLNPGEDCENIQPCGRHFTDIPEDFYDSESSSDEKDTDNTPSLKNPAFFPFYQVHNVARRL